MCGFCFSVYFTDNIAISAFLAIYDSTDTLVSCMLVAIIFVCKLYHPPVSYVYPYSLPVTLLLAGLLLILLQFFGSVAYNTAACCCCIAVFIACPAYYFVQGSRR